MECKNPSLTKEKPFSRNVERVALNISRVSFAESWLGRVSIKMGVQENIPLARAPGYMEDPLIFALPFSERKEKAHTRSFHTENL